MAKRGGVIFSWKDGAGDGEGAGQRRVVGAGRAVDPEGRAALPVSGSEADRRPQGVDGDLVRVADGDPVGVPAAGDGLRVGDDVLAQVAGVAGGGCVAAAARAVAGQVARGGSDRLVAGGGRQLACAGRWGGEQTGPSPVDRGRSGSKHHTVTCGRGTPLALSVSAANRNDISELLPLIDAIPPVRGKRGRPRRRPGRLYGDGAYHSRRHRVELRARGIAATISRPKQPHGSGLGRQRWVVERTISWLHQYRRLRVRYERRADIHQAFLQIAGCLICLKLLNADESF